MKTWWVGDDDVICAAIDVEQKKNAGHNILVISLIKNWQQCFVHWAQTNKHQIKTKKNNGCICSVDFVSLSFHWLFLIFNILQVQTPEDILNAKRLVFPGVGAFAAAMDVLNQKG